MSMSVDDDAMPDDVAVTTDEDEPVTELQTVFAEAQAKICDAGSGGEAMRAAMDAAEEMAEIEVEASAAESEQVNMMAHAFLNDLSDAHDALTRKPIRNVWENARENLEKQQKLETGEAVVFNDLLEDVLVGVTKKVTTDLSSTEETEYVLEFRDGTGLTVTQSTLMDERALWKAYTAAMEGDYPERYGSEESDWDNFIGSLIEDLETVEQEVGPRTAALNALENYVKSSTAYGNLVDAVEKGGVYVDDEPPKHSEVRVPREAIASITSTHEITDRALQAELSARGLSGPSLDGDKVSYNTSVNGRWQTFWHLDGDYFDEVGPYEEEAADPIDRMDDVAPDDDSDASADSVDLIAAFAWLFDDDSGANHDSNVENSTNNGTDEDDDGREGGEPVNYGDDGDDGDSPGVSSTENKQSSSDVAGYGKIGASGLGTGGDEE